MVHGGETWAPNISDLQRLCRNDRAMIKCICSAKLADHTPIIISFSPSKSWYHGNFRLAIIAPTQAHVQRATSCINKTTGLVIPGLDIVVG